jgi:hypothetical protein
MGRLFSWVVALGAAACGSVATTSDARQPDADNGLTCSGSQLACNGACVDPMTTAAHCGACDLACTSSETCQAGHCTDTITHCSQIHDVNPMAANGMYTLIDSTFMYCDMTNMRQFDSLILAQYDSNPTGYTLISAADLADATNQAAFIGLFNAQGGFNVPVGWASGNCCFKNDSAATTTMLMLSGSIVFSTTAGAVSCGNYLTTTVYQMQIVTGSVFINPPLASNFFTTHPASSGANCGATTNPAMFWKRHPW